jgi:hypothetical protein
MRRLVIRGGLACLSLLVLLSSSWTSVAQVAQDGIAKKYVRDAGIQNDPDVVMSEMFEGTSVANILSRWTTSDNSGGMSLVSDVPGASGGSRSLLMTSVGGSNEGGQLYKRLAPGHDQLYLRYYIKYGAAGNYHHTGGWMGGYNPPTDWPQGGAGDRPTGSDRFSVGAEPLPNRQFDLYTYYMRMRPSPGGPYWGNTFVQNPSLTLVTDRWICVEMMIKMNNPVSASNGELALWMDGTQIIHLREGAPRGRWTFNIFTPDPSGSPFEGFQWRNASQLNLNWIWLLYYTTGNPSGLVGRVWFDHMVLAKKYIGPINTLPAGDTVPPAAPTGLRVG